MRITAIILFLFVLFVPYLTHAAFPTTAVLDNFNRADTGPPPSASWSNPIFVGDGGLRVLSNALKQQSAQTYCNAYWNVSTFGADSEVYLTLSTLGADSVNFGNDAAILHIRLAQPNSSADGYELAIMPAGPSNWRIVRNDNEVSTQLGALASQSLSAGDSIGLEAIGSTIKGYRKNAGTWTEILSRSDSTYTGAGYIGAGFNDAGEAWVGDDFGGGTVVVSAAPSLMLLGVGQ